LKWKLKELENISLAGNNENSPAMVPYNNVMHGDAVDSANGANQSPSGPQNSTGGFFDLKQQTKRYWNTIFSVSKTRPSPITQRPNLSSNLTALFLELNPKVLLNYFVLQNRQ